jgi:hypothetical protein
MDVHAGNSFLGKMTFELSDKKFPDVDIIGIIGLAADNTFIQMLQLHQK